jgi:hypothetical protein
MGPFSLRSALLTTAGVVRLFLAAQLPWWHCWFWFLIAYGRSLRTSIATDAVTRLRTAAQLHPWFEVTYPSHQRYNCTMSENAADQRAATLTGFCLFAIGLVICAVSNKSLSLAIDAALVVISLVIGFTAARKPFELWTSACAFIAFMGARALMLWMLDVWSMGPVIAGLAGIVGVLPGMVLYAVGVAICGKEKG